MLNPPTARAALPIGVVCSMPPLLGITYTKSKALPKIFRECLIDGMEPKNHMGVKLRQEAARLGLKPAQVAAVFDVKPPSVYDWYEHGRIHKKHYAKLIAWSGKPLAWWLGLPDAMQAPPDQLAATQPHTVQDKACVYTLPTPKPEPMTLELLELFGKLDTAGKKECLSYVRIFAMGRRPHAHGPASAVAG